MNAIHKTISFSVDIEDYDELDRCAKHTGLTIAQFCKMAAFSHKKRYAQKERGKHGGV